MDRKRWSGAVVSAEVLSLTASLVASKDTSEFSLFSMRSHFDSLVFKSPPSILWRWSVVNCLGQVRIVKFHRSGRV
jgi:hypothetical protein